MPHSPSRQAGTPTFDGQTRLQVPQCCVLTEVFVSQPSTTPLMQSERPSLQSMRQVPPGAQLAVPPLLLQWFEQSPQVSGVLRSASHPSLTSPLQSSKPSSH